MSEIISRSDARARGLTHFFTGKPCSNGHIDKRFVSSNGCMSCERARNARRREEPEARRAAATRTAKWRLDPENRKRNATNAKRWRQEHPEEFRASVDKWQRENPDKARRSQQVAARKWRAAHPEVLRLHSKSRSRRVSRATPKWVDRAAVREIYAACPKGMTVDHFVPINGENVCGLHVPWNLQYLLPQENSAKGNQWPWQPEDERLAA